MSLNESIVQDAPLEWFGDLGYSAGHGSKQSRALAILRNAQMPKLLSGELSVAEEAAVT